ncbi:MAG TPA: hypothetical protein DCX54_03170, partial [Flavobacteriales bacterium]|nr:hypothetical protein [Flavobacteriales bacterium]
HSTSNKPGSFALIDSIRGNRTSDHLVWYNRIQEFFHVGVNDTLDHYYYLTSSSGCDGQQESVPTMKLRAMELDVTAISDSVNQLDWTQVTPSAISPNYIIWRDNGINGNSPYGTENSEDTWVVCNEQVTYHIEYPHPTIIDPSTSQLCVSTSPKVDGYFIDDTPPAKQFVDSVSMRRDTTFTGMIGWKKNTSKDVTKYYVMNCLPGSYKILDTVNAGSPLFYMDNANAPLEAITQYTVTAQDSCGNNNLSKQQFDCHATIFVKPVMDFCDQSILLQWNAYEDFASGAAVGYVIYVSENGSPYKEVGMTTEPKFKYSELVNGNNYCFYITGWENDGAGPISSSSAVVCIDADFIRRPAFAYLRYATVVDTNLARMCMKVDLDADIGEYWVKRSNKKDEGYKVIATVELPDPLTPADSNFCFDDIDVNTTKMSYYYKIDVVDPCGEVGRSSNVGHTMLLSVVADNDKNRNFLTWNHYEEWAGGVNNYEVWRGTSVSNMTKIMSLPVYQFGSIDGLSVNKDGIQYIDNVSNNQNIQGNGEFCYYVVANEGTGTFMQIEPERSKSNTVCAVQHPLFYVPNSFTPNGDGVNDYFMPKGAFHDVKAYKLEVFNRWGEMIYSTDNYNSNGWDGTYKGTPAPTGSYVYVVNYTSADGLEYEKRGTVAITR